MISDQVGQALENEDNVVDEADQDDLVVPLQYDITSYGADYDVEGLVKRLDRDDIFVPPFQRAYVWNLGEASRFIESLLLGLPVPGVFLAREVDSKRLLVIDGQQRLKTLQFFYNGFFNPKPDDKTHRVFKLLNVQPQFEGLTKENLKDDDLILLNDSIIHATIVKQDSPPEAENTSIYHIFERLNTSGRKLTGQQIRVAIYHGLLTDQINELNGYPNWRSIYGRISPTLKDQELILRFLAMYLNGDNYKRPMKEFLNQFNQRKRKPSEKFLSSCSDIFKQSIDLVFDVIGNTAFRPERALNAAVFDSVLVGIAKRLENEKKIDNAKFKKAYDELLSEDRYIECSFPIYLR